MKSWAIILGLVAMMMLAACEQRKETGVATDRPIADRQGPVEGPVADRQGPIEGPVAGGPAAERENGAVGGPIADRQGPIEGPIADRQGAIEGPSAEREVAGDTMSRPDTAAGEQAATSRESSEFLGQSPAFGNAPETIVLKASNGNVTLSHKKHAGLMDCKTCHGESTPGQIEGFSKDQAHALCTGCHKEKGAGPTKCQECHKKQ